MRAVFVVLMGVLVEAGSYAQNMVRVSTYRYADNDRVKNIQPFAFRLSKECSCQTEVTSYESVAAMDKGMTDGEPDLVFMNTLGYLLYEERQQAYEPLAALRVAPGKNSTYQSVIVASSSTGLRSMEDLTKAPGLRLLLVNTGSTSGNLVPRLGLASVGIVHPESFFKEIKYSGNHALTLKLVSEGKADVGAFGKEVYDKLHKAQPDLISHVRVLWTSSDIPLGPVVIKKGAPRKFRACVEKLLLTLHESDATALESIKGGWTEALPADRYMPIEATDYHRWLRDQGEKNEALAIIRQFSN